MEKPNVIDFNKCKDRAELSQMVKGGIAACTQLLDFCEAGATYSTVNMMLTDQDKFCTLQTLIMNFHSSISSINAGIDYLVRHEFVEEVNAIERLNTRADKVYARLYRLYHDVLIAKQGDANVVLLKRK